MPMGNLDPSKAAQRWATNTGGAVTKYKDAIQNLDFNPLERAANDDGRYIMGCQAGDQKRKSKLLAYGGERWKAITIKKAGRLGEGAAASQDKYLAAAQKLFPYIQQVKQGLPPRGSKDMNKQRMIQNFEQMSMYKQTAY